MSESPKSEEVIFGQAIGLPADERKAFLDQACGGDAALRARIEALLQAHVEAGSLLDAAPGGAVRAALARPPLEERPGAVIGRYKLLQKIGEGGCGVVYMAEQSEPVQRRVALKVIKLGMDTREVIARFEAERQALAMMDHPNIAKVLDGGTTEAGRPFFVMELVRGVPITKYSDEHNLPTPARLELFMQVCAAVQHAHQKGIIHRDLKPSNILVTLNDGVPVPKVIDFGIAKATQGRLTDRTLFTAFEQFIGTPAYMSPEQAEMSSLDVDTRSDIYSLGVLLYELLTGQTPFDVKSLVQAGLDEVRRIIREVEPPRPSARLSTLTDADRATVAKLRGTASAQLSTLLRGDLDWIVMRCLEKDRARRYETANSLAEDIRRHLESEPVVARPPSGAYLFKKLFHRHRLAFGAAAAIAAILLLGTVISTWQALRAIAAEREAKTMSAVAQVQSQTAKAARVKAEADRKMAETEAAKSQQVAKFLGDMLASVSPSVALGRDTKLLREILEKTAERVGQDLKDQPAVEAELRLITGRVYRALSELDKAESMLREALALQKKIHGPEHPDVATVLFWLASIRYDRGDYATAEPMMHEALAMRRRLLVNDHPDIAMSLLGLGGVRFRLGDYAGAEALWREGLAIEQKSSPGGASRAATAAVDGLAAVLMQRGDYAGAEGLWRDALATRRKLFGNEHPDVANLLSNLGSLLIERRNYAEAESVCREALSIRRKLLDNEHPDIAISIILLGKLQLERGNYAEAEALFRESLDMRSRLLGPEHPFTVSSLTGLAATLLRRGQYTEAEPLFRDVLAIQRRRFGNEHPEVAGALANLGSVLIMRDNYAAAESSIREALAMQQRLLGSENQPVANSLANLGSVLMKRGDYAAAELPIREALAMQQKLLGSENLAVAGSLANLGGVLLKQGNNSEAEKQARAALALQRKLGGNYPDELACLNLLGMALTARGEWAESETTLRAAWRICEDHPGMRLDSRHETVGCLFYLYAAWSKTDSTKTVLATEWQQRLKEFNEASPAMMKPDSPTASDKK